MKNYLITSLLLILFSSCDEPKSSFERIEMFESNFIEDRTIQIYLPRSYSESDRRYPVLYMHDGQMLFDSTQTWNGQEWGVDEVMDKLIASGEIPEAIVVGVWNGGTSLRHPEYFPQKPFESLGEAVTDSLYKLGRSADTPLFGYVVQSNEYLKFLVKELKPYIDKQYHTLPERENTFIMGSSMGGLISMYAICEYPDVFGGAACLSTHWPGTFSIEENPIPDAFFNYLSQNSPDPSSHKLYFDYGTETLDALYQDLQPQADSVLWKNGYTDENFLTKKFEGDLHDERSWNRRLHVPLTFLLAN